MRIMRPITKVFPALPPQDNDPEFEPRLARNLGSSIFDQRYTGITEGASTLLHGQYDDPDCDKVDPLCDFDTDRFGVRSVVAPQPTSTESTTTE